MQIPTEMIHYGMAKTAQLSVSRGLADRWSAPASRSTACPLASATTGAALRVDGGVVKSAF